MSRKIDIMDIDNLIKRYGTGESIKNMARELGVSTHVIRNRFSKAGVIMRPSGRLAKVYPSLDEMLAIYNTGIGIKGIVAKLGTSSGYVKRTFKLAGIKIRNPHEQQLERMRRASPEERQRLTKAAHDAVRGKKRDEALLIKSAITKYEGKIMLYSPYEEALAKILRDRSIDFVQQYPIASYNCDFMINGVAVEIFGGGWHFHGTHAARFAERTKKILGAGHSIIFVVVDQWHKIDAAIADKIISEVNILSRDKTGPRQYRVIWRTPDLVTGGSADDANIAIVYPFTNRRDPTTGRYERVPRNAVNMAR